MSEQRMTRGGVKQDVSTSRRSSSDRSSVVGGSIWMVGLSLVLFFIPGINGLIGGLVGGYKVGSVGRALMAAILPAIVVGFGMWLLMVAFDLPLIGIAAGFAVGILVLLADLGLFIGAAIGGALSSHRPGPAPARAT